MTLVSTRAVCFRFATIRYSSTVVPPHLLPQSSPFISSNHLSPFPLSSNHISLSGNNRPHLHCSRRERNRWKASPGRGLILLNCLYSIEPNNCELCFEKVCLAFYILYMHVANIDYIVFSIDHRSPDRFFSCFFTNLLLRPPYYLQLPLTAVRHDGQLLELC